MTDQLGLPLDDDSVPLGTARGIPLGVERNGMGKYVVTREGVPGGDWCGRQTWGVGTVVWVEGGK